MHSLKIAIKLDPSPVTRRHTIATLALKATPRAFFSFINIRPLSLALAVSFPFFSSLS